MAHLPIANLTVLTDVQKERVRSRLTGRINVRDELVVHAEQERRALANRRLAIERLTHLIMAVLEVRRSRIHTRPTASSRERRLRAKRTRSRIKGLRRRAEEDR